jgi:hypothetical protein
VAAASYYIWERRFLKLKHYFKYRSIAPPEAAAGVRDTEVRYSAVSFLDQYSLRM